MSAKKSGKHPPESLEGAVKTALDGLALLGKMGFSNAEQAVTAAKVMDAVKFIQKALPKDHTYSGRGGRRLLGHVAVDTGQIVLMDPSIAENQWRRRSESNPVAVLFWGAGADDMAKTVLGWDDVVLEKDTPDIRGYQATPTKESGLTCDALRQRIMENLPEKTVVTAILYDGTLDAAFRATHGKNLGGAVYPTMPGFAVCVSTAYGDGLYPVYGYVGKNGELLQVLVDMR